MKALKLFHFLVLGMMMISGQVFSQDCDVNSGRITAEGSTSVCVNDGEDDNLMISVEGNTGDGGWIITDDEGTILGLPPSPPFNFEGVPLGTCVVWHISSEGEVAGLAADEKIFFLGGCYDLSNPIAVNRYNAPEGGEIATTDGLTEFSICAGDGEADPFTVNVSGGEGQSSAWVITDSELNILGLPPGPTFDLDGAGAGTCLVWYLRWNGELVGAEVGANAADLSGCFALSNPITVERNQPEGASISTGGATEISICVDDVPDPFTVNVEGGRGANQLWVITDLDLNILGTPPGPTFDLNPAGVGTCLVWYLNYADDVNLEGVTNAGDLEGCFALSNPITVYRTETSAAEIETTDGETELSICAGDGEPDPFTVVVEGGEGDNQAWIITDSELNVLGSPEGPTFDLDGAGPGTCLVWYLTYADGVSLDVANAADLEGCFALSNPITVVRNAVEAAEISTDGATELTICAGDGEPDPFTVDVNGGQGANSAWIITDSDLNVLGSPEGPTFDLDGAGPGTCLVWYLTYADGVSLDVSNAADLEGCFALSNPITVIRQDAEECESSCAAPADVEISNIKKRKVTISWTAVDEGLFYYVRFRPAGTSYWYYRFTSNTGGVIKGLHSGTEYEVQVLSYCANGEFSDWSASTFFTTLSNSNGKAPATEDFQDISTLNVYPNPVQDKLNLDTNIGGESVQIQIISSSGQVLKNVNFNGNELTSLNTSDLKQGTYIISITNGEEVISKTFVKN